MPVSNLLTGEWNAYRGSQGKIDWGVTRRDSYEGLACHHLAVTDISGIPSDSYVNFAILASGSDGYVAGKAIPVYPDTEYTVRSYVKSKLPEIAFGIALWKEPGQSIDRQHVELPFPRTYGNSPYIKSTGKWQELIYSFKTLPNTAWASPTWKIATAPIPVILNVPLYVDAPIMVKGDESQLPPKPILKRNTLLGVGLGSVIGGVTSTKYPVSGVGRTLPVIAAGLGAVIGGAAGILAPELKLPELPLTGESRCPVCEMLLPEKPMGEDVHCPGCGFVSAYTR